MGYQKKRKTQHLSDAEIWDDSALIQSWDEAVAEYEVSHAIKIEPSDTMLTVDSTIIVYMLEVKMLRKS